MNKTEQTNLKQNCCNFFNKLLQISGRKSKQLENNIRVVIQSLIDSKISVDEFCQQIGTLLNTTFNKNVYDVLQMGVPPLKRALYCRELSIEGINPTVNLTLQPPKIITKVNNKETSLQMNASNPSNPKLDVEVIDVNAENIVAEVIDVPDIAVNTVDHQYHITWENENALEFKEVSGGPTAEAFFLNLHALKGRFDLKMLDYGLLEQSKEIFEFLSRACKEHMKLIVEKLIIIGEHRCDSLKANPRYEICKNIRGQLKFLEEIDKAEQKRQKELEREILIRASKMKITTKNPEIVRMRAKAKELQRTEMEEMRQRDADLTALHAIGPRKKPKIEVTTTEEAGTGIDNEAINSTVASATTTASNLPIVTRTKRVNIQDVLFFMEHDSQFCRSQMLYEAYFK